MTGCAERGYHTQASIVGSPRAPLEGFVEPYHWPLAGNVLAPYGAKDDGVSLNGVLISAREGSEVKAAGTGRVVYVDEKLRGYGKIVIVDHGNGFSTVYARVSKILVRQGQSVAKGEPIAKVGRGGKGNLPQLYFELRKNSRTEDPLRYLHVQ